MTELMQTVADAEKSDLSWSEIPVPVPLNSGTGFGGQRGRVGTIARDEDHFKNDRVIDFLRWLVRTDIGSYRSCDAWV
jgi:hypothetical protein